MSDISVDFQTALESCLHEIGRGESLEGCLARYPLYADRLKPYLETVIHMRQLSALERQIFADAPIGVSFNVALNHSIQMLMRGNSLEHCYSQYPEYATELKPWLDAVLDLREHGSSGTVKSIGFSDENLPSPQISFQEAMEDCLGAVARGETPEAALARQPYYANQMRRWVYYVATLRPRMDLNFQTTLPEYKDPQPKGGKGFPKPRSRSYSLSGIVVSVLLMVVFLLGGNELILASIRSIPGDSLYPVKRVIEKVQLEILPESQEMREFIAIERRREAQALLKIRREAEVDFEGEIIFVDSSMAVISNVGTIFFQPGVDFSHLKRGNVIHVEGHTDIKKNGIVVDAVALQQPAEPVPPTAIISPVATVPVVLPTLQNIVDYSPTPEPPAGETPTLEMLSVSSEATVIPVSVTPDVATDIALPPLPPTQVPALTAVPPVATEIPSTATSVPVSPTDLSPTDIDDLPTPTDAPPTEEVEFLPDPTDQAPAPQATPDAGSINPGAP